METARLLGREGDYETVAAVSGNAFSPRIDLGEDCTAWWHVEGRDAGMELVCSRLGLSARRIELPEMEIDWDNEDGIGRFHRAAAGVYREAMANGEVVLSYNSWTGPPGEFAPWGWFGIITHAPEDGDIRGACLNGKSDNRALWPGVNWAISRADDRMSAPHADLAALRNVVAQIRGTGEMFAPPERVVFGLAAMDAWIDKMGHAPFCEPCYGSAPDKVWTCAINNGEAAMASAKVAASYLRTQAEAFGAGGRLADAAGRYDRIVALLEPAVTGDGGGHYRDFIGDIDAQKRHAGVLREVRAELAAVADDLEAALANTPADI